MQMPHEVCLLLLDYLDVSDVFRLWIAFCKLFRLDRSGMEVICTRMKLRFHTRFTMDILLQKFRKGRHCWQCGIPTTRKIGVCVPCADGHGPYALRDRTYIRQQNKQLQCPKKNIENLIRASWPVAKTAVGRFLYWKCTIDAMLK